MRPFAKFDGLSRSAIAGDLVDYVFAPGRCLRLSFSGFLNAEEYDINHSTKLPRILMNIYAPHAHHQEVPSLHRALDEVRREKAIRDQASVPDFE